MTLSAEGTVARPRVHRWRAVFLAPATGPTRRRGSDAVRLVTACLVVVMCGLVVRTNSHSELAVEHFLHPPPNGIRWLVTAVWYAGSLGTIAVLVVFGLALRRRAMTRDAALAGLAAWAVCGLFALVLGIAGGRPFDPALEGINQGFPLARIAATIAVTTAARPYLSRGLQRLLFTVIALVSVATVADGAGLPVNVVASLAVGWGVTAALRLALGSPLGLPAPGEVAAAVGDLGMEVREVTPVRRQVWGVARYTCADTEGRRLNLSVYGRDAADAQVLAKAWRALFYRDSGPTLAVTRVQQVEHEAYLTLLAARTGALVPEVLAAAPAGSSRDAVLATVPPEGLRLVDVEGASVSDGAVDDILANVVRLRRGGIAHGAISTETIVVGPSGSSGLVDFRRASAHAPQARLDQDMASALAAVATAVGVERTVASARRVLPSEVIASSLPHLQVAALDPVTSRAIRVKRSMLTDLRNQAASAVGIEPPELAEPRRVSWASLIFVLGTLIGGWALIGVLVNVSSSFDTIVGAQWGWVIGVFLLAQSVFVVSAVADVGSIAGPIVFSRAVALEFSNSFTALAAGTLGALTTRVRFFQKQGYPATLAVSSGALISTASWVVKGTLFLVALPFGLSAIDFSKHPSGGSSHLVWLVIVIVIAAGLIGGLVLAIPRLRRLARDKLRPRWDDVAANMRQLAGQPRKIVQIIGGCVGAQLLVALALGASLHAFGQHLSIATILIVLTLSSMVGGVSPTPGGMGVVEAGMIYLLTAAGISQNDAVAAVFVQRLFTAYLPPIWGWFTLAWMRRREYV